MSSINELTPAQKRLYEQMQAKENAGLTDEEIAQKNKEKELKKKRNIAILNETLSICKMGNYTLNGKTISLPEDENTYRTAQVYLPDDVHAITTKIIAKNDKHTPLFRCENCDAISMAWDNYHNPIYNAKEREGRLLLLNFASSIRPGGAVRDGMGGQEEALCRGGTLLYSLESPDATPFYAYHKEHESRLNSDAMILSPNVILFRDGDGKLLDAPIEVAVLTCAAPNIRFGREGLTEAQYDALLKGRIESIVAMATHFGYRNVILGAFGCGIFGNDATVVAEHFHQALTSSMGQDIDHADFAVLCAPQKVDNYHAFCRFFTG